LGFLPVGLAGAGLGVTEGSEDGFVGLDVKEGRGGVNDGLGSIDGISKSPLTTN